MSDYPQHMTTTEKVHLYGWTDSLEFPVLSLLFGEMVRRATPIVQHYQSDLFHDALWLYENLTEPCTFEWIVRPCGTNIAASARIQVKIGPGAGSVFYRIEVIHERGMWSALFTRIPLEEVPVDEEYPYPNPDFLSQAVWARSVPVLAD